LSKGANWRQDFCSPRAQEMQNNSSHEEGVGGLTQL
jgi:hypothetical protein